MKTRIATDDDDDHDVLSNLDDLFTIQQYETVTVEIPSTIITGRNFPKIDDNNAAAAHKAVEDDDDAGRVIRLEIWQSPAACTDYDRTGEIVWPVSIWLSRYLASNHCQQEIWQKQRRQQQHSCRNDGDLIVVELGAGGTAVPSLTVAAAAAATAGDVATRVIATDGNDGPVYDLLVRNISAAQQRQHTSTNHPTTILKHRQLVWGNPNHIRELLEQETGQPPSGMIDVVIAADVVQWPAVLEPLLETVKALLWKKHLLSTTTTSTKMQEGVFLLGIVNRASSTYQLFFKLATQLGFACRKIVPKEFIPPMNENENESSLHRQEDHRHVTEVYRLHLRSDATPPDFERTTTVGTTFDEHTTALPC